MLNRSGESGHPCFIPEIKVIFKSYLLELSKEIHRIK
jgi:hypothetical protein